MAMKNKKIIFIVSLLVILSYQVIAQEHIIDGDTIYLDNKLFNRSASPHTLTADGYIYFDSRINDYSGNMKPMLIIASEVGKPIYGELWNPHNETIKHQRTCACDGWSNKTYSESCFYKLSGELNVLECYRNKTDTTTYTENLVWKQKFESLDSKIDTIYWNTYRLENWTTISMDAMSSSEYKNTNSLVYSFKDISIDAGKDYLMRVWIELNPTYSGKLVKYDWCSPPSFLTFDQAKYTDNLYCLDPWIYPSWDTRYNLTISDCVGWSNGKDWRFNNTAELNKTACTDDNIRVYNYDTNSTVSHYSNLSNNELYFRLEGCSIGGSADYAIYCGNPLATSTGSGLDTFDFYDDCEDNLINDTIWWVNDTHYTISEKEGAIWMESTSEASGLYDGVMSKKKFSGNYILEVEWTESMKKIGGDWIWGRGNLGWSVIGSYGDNKTIYNHWDESDRLIVGYGGSERITTLSTNNFKKNEIGYTVRAYIDRNNNSGTWFYATNETGDVISTLKTDYHYDADYEMPVGINAHSSTSADYHNITLKWIMLRFNNESYYPIFSLGEIEIQLKIGASCTVDEECGSGFCVDGYCCNSSCDGVCERCNITGVLGNCTYISIDTDPDNECPNGYGDCAGDYCNGAGACEFLTGDICRSFVGDCDINETCQGDSFDCPVDAKIPAGEGVCDVCTRCDGINDNCQNITDNTQDDEGSNLCNQECKTCDGIGSCVNQDGGEDLFSQCVGLGCDGSSPTPYYWGWDALTCYYMENISASNHYCSADGDCGTKAEICPTSSQNETSGITCGCIPSESECNLTVVGSCNDMLCPAPQITSCIVNQTMALNDSSVMFSASITNTTFSLDNFWINLNYENVSSVTANNGTNDNVWSIDGFELGNYSFVCWVNDTMDLSNYSVGTYLSIEDTTTTTLFTIVANVTLDTSWFERIYFAVINMLKFDMKNNAHYKVTITNTNCVFTKDTIIFEQYTIGASFTPQQELADGMYCFVVQEYEPVSGQYGLQSDPIYLIINSTSS